MNVESPCEGKYGEAGTDETFEQQQISQDKNLEHLTLGIFSIIYRRLQEYCVITQQYAYALECNVVVMMDNCDRKKTNNSKER